MEHSETNGFWFGLKRSIPGCYVSFHKQLGDLVLLEPSLTKLRDYHGVPVRLMTRGGFRPLLELMPGIQFVLGPPLAISTTAYCYDHLTKSAIRSVLTPTLFRKAVLPEAREVTKWHRRVFPKITGLQLGREYVAKYFWENTPVPSSKSFRPPQLIPPPTAWRPAFLPEFDYILCSPTAGWHEKSWTAEYWAQTLLAVYEMTGLPIFVTGESSGWQLKHCQQIERLAAPAVTSLAGKTSLQNFLWLSANAKMILAVDGAASHLATAFDIPALTLFGSLNMPNWHWPTPKHRALLSPNIGTVELPLRKFSPTTVIENIRELWSQAKDPG
ncbi:MAG: glycosyltransferase family 9 protein [Chthoniobacterales bacterium]